LKNLNYNELLAILSYELDKNKFEKRFFIALAGPPACGKSTISEKLNNDLNIKGFSSGILQMDGFHFDDSILLSKNLLLKKGAPETFDVMGLKNFLERLNNEEEVVVPVFDRSLELSRASAVVISKKIRVIIVEGNYLLLSSYPWSLLKDYFNLSIMINCNEKILEKRLIERWKGFGFSEQEIDQKIYSNDLPNALNVVKNSIKPDFLLDN
jgi:pantothenate kinase